MKGMSQQDIKKMLGKGEEFISNDAPKDVLAKRFPGLAIINNEEEIQLELDDLKQEELPKQPVEEVLPKNTIKRKTSFTSGSSKASSGKPTEQITKKKSSRKSSLSSSSIGSAISADEPLVKIKKTPSYKQSKLEASKYGRNKRDSRSSSRGRNNKQIKRKQYSSTSSSVSSRRSNRRDRKKDRRSRSKTRDNKRDRSRDRSKNDKSRQQKSSKRKRSRSRS